MTDATVQSSETFRWRAISFASSALILGALLALLIVTSRVTTYIDDWTAQGVTVEIEEQAPPPNVRAAQRPATPPTYNAPTNSMLTPIPIGRDMLARSLSCLNRRPEDRSADCPPTAAASSQPDYTGLYTMPLDPDAPAPVHLDRIFTPAELATIMAEPPCIPGLTLGSFTVTHCSRIGFTPPPPSRSAEEICEAGFVGPCRPPPFRAEDVVRLTHTE